MCIGWGTQEETHNDQNVDNNSNDRKYRATEKNCNIMGNRTSTLRLAYILEIKPFKPTHLLVTRSKSMDTHINNPTATTKHRKGVINFKEVVTVHDALFWLGCLQETFVWQRVAQIVVETIWHLDQAMGDSDLMWIESCVKGVPLHI
ncbi:hypothetical protein B0J17DRAFT_629213 [Rhizoctonia solani]|nr:hypothetical protein B0J17DRAFT_629213 [Rhizoctonia solani]